MGRITDIFSINSSFSFVTPEGKQFNVRFYKLRDRTKSIYNDSVYYNMELRIDFPGQIDFFIRQEDGFDRFAKSVGLSKEVQSGDQSFDDLFYISSDNDYSIKTIFKDRIITAAISRLFKQGATQVVFDAMGGWVTWSKLLTNNLSAVFSELEKDPQCIEAINIIYQIKDRVSEIIKTPNSGFILKRRKISNNNLVGYFAAIFSLLAIVSFFIGETSYQALNTIEIFKFSLKSSLPFFLILGFIIFNLVKGNSKSHLYFFPLIILLLIDSIFAGMGTASILNAKLDTSELSSHISLVRDKYSKKPSKSSRKYYVKYDSWETGDKTSSSDVKSSEYDSIVPGKTKIYLETKKGFFGFEWIVRKWLQ